MSLKRKWAATEKQARGGGEGGVGTVLFQGHPLACWHPEEFMVTEGMSQA